MKTIKLMADYFSYPLWQTDKDEVDNINPATLPLEAELLADLMQWADQFDALYDSDDPANSGFDDQTAQLAFHQTGLHLWQRLQKTLAGQYNVTYKSVLDERPLTAFSLDKAQFAVLLERAVGDPFVLDKAGLAQLELTTSDIRLAAEQLVAAQILKTAEGKGVASISPKIRSILAMAIAPKQQVVAQLRRRNNPDEQISIAFSDDGIVADTVDHKGAHTFNELLTVADAAEFLVYKTPVPSQSSDEVRTLSSLLPQMQAMTTLLLVDNQGQEEQQAKASVVWLVTKEGAWWIDADSAEQQAQGITIDALRNKLIHLLGWLSK